MFYLMTHCNLWLYGISHMVNDHSDSERKTTVTTTWATGFEKQVRSGHSV